MRGPVPEGFFAPNFAPLRCRRFFGGTTMTYVAIWLLLWGLGGVLLWEAF